MTFPQSASGLEMYSWSRLYLIAAELYEKEYQLEKALCAIDSSKKNGWDKAVCVERHAEILAKIDINQAVKVLIFVVFYNRLVGAKKSTSTATLPITYSALNGAESR